MPRKTTFILAAVVALAIPTHAGGSKTDACHRVELGPEAAPGWTLSGSWLGPDLVLADALNDHLWLYDGTGRSLGEASLELVRHIEESTGSFQLSSMAQGGASTLYLETMQSIVRIDTRSETVADLLGFQNLELRGGARLAAVYDWAPLRVAHSTYVVAFGEVRPPGGTWRPGFVVLDWKKPKSSRIFLVQATSPEVAIWYRLGFSYMASTGGRTYALWMDRSLRLLEITPDGIGVPLDILPEAVQRPPDLRELDSPRDFVELMASVEASTMPVGLYAWKGRLYLLWRQASEDGHSWMLSHLDPERGGVVSTTLIPSKAPHLFAVPGPAQWAFVEKGPVEGFGLQEVRSLLFVPSTALDPSQENRLGSGETSIRSSICQ